ncbi:MAG TPA: fibronectin type III domain-containing protein, partial [Balneolales bacterium]|nr:fibronectin type III domain-containing protein [Balneolales bacterium]
MKRKIILTSILALVFVHCKNILNPASSSSKPNKPVLVSPPDGATNQLVNPTLSWDKVKGATKYRVQISKDQQFHSILVDSVTDSTSLKIIDLQHDSTYNWKVRAVSGLTWGPWSNIRQFTTLSSQDTANTYRTTLTSPANGTANQPTTVTLQWSKVTNGTGYELQISTKNDFSSIYLDTTVQAESYQVSGLAKAQQYFWKVKPIVSSGNPVWSDIWDFSTKSGQSNGGTSGTNMWITAYLFSYNHLVPGNNGGNLPTSAIDWSVLTQLDYFAVNV